MYATFLNPTERDLLCRLARALMESDGKVTPEEVTYLEACATSLGLDPSDYSRSEPLPSLLLELSSVGSRRSARILLMELISIALADGEYCARERADTRRVASAIGVDDVTLAAIEEWTSLSTRAAVLGSQLFISED